MTHDVFVAECLHLAIAFVSYMTSTLLPNHGVFSYLLLVCRVVCVDRPCDIACGHYSGAGPRPGGKVPGMRNPCASCVSHEYRRCECFAVVVLLLSPRTSLRSDGLSIEDSRSAYHTSLSDRQFHRK